MTKNNLAFSTYVNNFQSDTNINIQLANELLLRVN